MCDLNINRTHQGESEPELDPNLGRVFQLQQDSENAHGRRRMFLLSAQSPNLAQKELERRHLKTVYFIPSSNYAYLIYLHELSLVGLLMHSLPAFLACRCVLDVQVVAVDGAASIKHRRFPQDHNRGVTNLHHIETNRGSLEDQKPKLYRLKNFSSTGEYFTYTYSYNAYLF